MSDAANHWLQYRWKLFGTQTCRRRAALEWFEWKFLLWTRLQKGRRRPVSDAARRFTAGLLLVRPAVGATKSLACRRSTNRTASVRHVSGERWRSSILSRHRPWLKAKTTMSRASRSFSRRTIIFAEDIAVNKGVVIAHIANQYEPHRGRARAGRLPRRTAARVGRPLAARVGAAIR